MISNGSNHSRNSTWQFLLSLFELEVLAFKIVIGCILVVASTTLLRRIFAISSENERHTPEKIYPSVREKISTYSENFIHKSENELPTILEKNVTEPIPITIKEETKEKILKEESPEELKKKAIEQILRGW